MELDIQRNSTYELIDKALSGDKESLAKLVEENMGLVYSIAKKFLNRGVDFDDLVQLGSVGLINAIKKFDTNYGVMFSTYAVPLIVGEIKRFLRDDGQIKVSRVYRTIAFKAGSAKEKLIKKLGREPTVGELAEELNVDVCELVTAFEATQSPESIYKTVDESDNIHLVDKISGGVDNENDVVERLTVEDILKNLSERERKIILLRYFKEKKQTEVAKLIGVSQVQVSRLEKQILLKMREKFG